MGKPGQPRVSADKVSDFFKKAIDAGPDLRGSIAE